MDDLNGMQSPEAVDPIEHVHQQELYDEKYDKFMTKHLKRAWPKCVVRLLGAVQLLIALAILGVDLPIILMYAPRWEIFAGVWTFVIAFIACVSTLHSTRKTTWGKLKWAAAFNIITGIAAAVMLAFNILYLANSSICLVASGCNYLWYTYSAANSYYVGEVVLGIALLLSVFIFLIIFIKYGVGGSTLFENIQKGWASSSYESIISSDDNQSGLTAPRTGAGVSGAAPGFPAPYMQQHPNNMMVPGPRGQMMMSGPRGQMMMMPGPRGPAMMPGPHGQMMMPPGPRGQMTMPGPRGQMMMIPGPRGPVMAPVPPGPMMMPGQRGPLPQQQPRGSMPPHYQ